MIGKDKTPYEAELFCLAKTLSSSNNIHTIYTKNRNICHGFIWMGQWAENGWLKYDGSVVAHENLWKLIWKNKKNVKVMLFNDVYARITKGLAKRALIKKEKSV